MGQDLTLTALQKALDQHPAPEVHHSDQGGQYAAKAYVKLLRESRHANQHGRQRQAKRKRLCIERLIRTIKEEEVYPSDYQTIDEAREQLGYFIDVDYNQLRPHSGLDYLTPQNVRHTGYKVTPQMFWNTVSNKIGPLHPSPRPPPRSIREGETAPKCNREY